MVDKNVSSIVLIPRNSQSSRLSETRVTSTLLDKIPTVEAHFYTSTPVVDDHQLSVQGMTEKGKFDSFPIRSVSFAAVVKNAIRDTEK